jgi:hypothetical protein
MTDYTYPPASGGSGNATQLQGRNVSNAAPTDQYVLTWVGANSDWEPATAAGGAPTGAAGGDLGGTYPNPTVAKVQGNAVLAGAPSDKAIYTWVNANSRFEAKVPGGDVSGSIDALTVAKIQGSAVHTVAPTNGQILVWVNANTRYEAKSPAGDLGGTWLAPTVAAVTTTSGPQSLTIGAWTDGQYGRRSGNTLIGATVQREVEWQASSLGSTTGTRYLNDGGSASAVTATQTQGQRVMMNAGTVTDLRGWLTGATASGNETLTLQVNGTDSALSVTITNPATTNVTTGASVSFNAGDALGIKSVCSAAETVGVRAAILYTPS